MDKIQELIKEIEYERKEQNKVIDELNSENARKTEDIIVYKKKIQELEQEVKSYESRMDKLKQAVGGLNE